MFRISMSRLASLPSFGLLLPASAALCCFPLLPCLRLGLCIVSFFLPSSVEEARRPTYVLYLIPWREKLETFLTRLALHGLPLLCPSPQLCFDPIFTVFGNDSRMADHFALMAGRLLTESTLQSAILEAFDVPSMKNVYDPPDPSVPEAVQDGRPKSGVLVECRICQEEGDEAYMEIPCSCKGSLKYAHHICIQRWCNEKGDTICEICLQQFIPNYTAPLKLFRHGRNPISFRRAGERPENLNAGHGQENVAQTADHAAGTSTFDSQGSNPKGVIYCRVVAIVLMALLVLRDAISLILGGPEVYSMALITLLMFRTAGIAIPIYIILISITTLLHRYNQHQAVHETAVSEPGEEEGLQPMPPQQHIISIQ